MSLASAPSPAPPVRPELALEERQHVVGSAALQIPPPPLQLTALLVTAALARVSSPWRCPSPHPALSCLLGFWAAPINWLHLESGKTRGLCPRQSRFQTPYALPTPTVEMFQTPPLWHPQEPHRTLPFLEGTQVMCVQVLV